MVVYGQFVEIDDISIVIECNTTDVQYRDSFFGTETVTTASQVNVEAMTESEFACPSTPKLNQFIRVFNRKHEMSFENPFVSAKPCTTGTKIEIVAQDYHVSDNWYEEYSK